MASPSSILAGKATIFLGLEDNQLKAGLNKSSSMLSNFASSASSLFQNLTFAHYALSNVVRPIVDVYAQFDDQMRLTKAVTGATGDQFQLLTDRAKQLGRDTAFTASEVASGMTALGRMGFTTDEIDKSISSVMDLSRATGTDLAQSADIAANSLRMFKLESSEMSHVADVLTAAANGAAQTLPDLFEALKMAGPQAATANESITDVAGAIGIMANVGIKGSLAGTALRRAYVNMANPKIQDFLKQYNIQTVDATGNLRKMKDIIMDVGRVMQSMGTAEKMSFAEEVFDMRGSFVGLSLGGNVEGMQEFIAKLEQAEGVAAKTAAEMESGMGGAIRLMTSAMEGLVIAIGETINDLIVFGAGFAENVTRNIVKFIEATPGIARVIAGIGVAVIPAIAGLIALAVGMKAAALASGLLQTAIHGVQTALTVLSSHPIIAILTVAAAAIALHVARLRIMAAEIENTKNKQAQLNRELHQQGAQNTQAQTNAVLATGDFDRLAELAELSRQQRLTNAELLEADALIQRLEPYGSSYYAQLDAVAGSLTLAADAQRRFNATANATQLPGLEAERDKILEIVKAIEAERDATIKRNGVRAVMRNQVAQEQAQVRIDEQMAKVNELKLRIDELKKPIPLDVQPPKDMPPSIADLENAAKTLAELETKMADAGKTDAQRKEDELQRQNALYQEQIDLLAGVAKAKAAQSQQAISELKDRQKDAFQSPEERKAAIDDATAKLDAAKERKTEAGRDVAGWQRWQQEGNELFDPAKLQEGQLQLFLAEEEVNKLQASLDKLNASETTADIQLKIDAEAAKLSEADAEIEALQKRLEDYEALADVARRKEATGIMADVAKRDEERNAAAEDENWRAGIDSIFKTSSIADAIDQATQKLNAERDNEAKIRSELDVANANNDTDAMRTLVASLQQSQERQGFIDKKIRDAGGAQQEAEKTGSTLAAGALAGFVTTDVMAMLGGGTGGPEEETAKNTRVMAENIAVMIDVIRTRKPAAFA